MANWSDDDLRAAGFDPVTGKRTRYTGVTYATSLPPAKPDAKPHKYRAKVGVAPDGSKTQSKLGAKLLRRLEEEKRAGRIVGYIPEPSIPCGVLDDGKTVRHRPDALVIIEVQPQDGTFTGMWIEAKGVDLAAGRAKRAAVQSLYGTPVKVSKTGELP